MPRIVCYADRLQQRFMQFSRSTCWGRVARTSCTSPSTSPSSTISCSARSDLDLDLILSVTLKFDWMAYFVVIFRARSDAVQSSCLPNWFWTIERLSIVFRVSRCPSSCSVSSPRKTPASSTFSPPFAFAATCPSLETKTSSATSGWKTPWLKHFLCNVLTKHVTLCVFYCFHRMLFTFLNLVKRLISKRTSCMFLGMSEDRGKPCTNSRKMWVLHHLINLPAQHFDSTVYVMYFAGDVTSTSSRFLQQTTGFVWKTLPSLTNSSNTTYLHFFINHLFSIFSGQQWIRHRRTDHTAQLADVGRSFLVSQWRTAFEATARKILRPYCRWVPEVGYLYACALSFSHARFEVLDLFLCGEDSVAVGDSLQLSFLFDEVGLESLPFTVKIPSPPPTPP